jgi:hypothetical protein
MAIFWSTGMGIDGYLTVCHGDHIHILCSRNRIDGGVVEDSGDYSKSEKLIREIEQRFDLTPVLPSHLIYKNRRSDHVAAPVRGELELAKRHVISVKSLLQNFLTDLISVPITASEFIFALETLGVDVRPNLDHESRGLRGLSFSYHGRSFRASTLGGAFTVAAMTERWFSYDSDRDFSNLVAAEHRSLAMPLTDRMGQLSQQIDRLTRQIQELLETKSNSKGVMLPSRSAMPMNAMTKQEHRLKRRKMEQDLRVLRTKSVTLSIKYNRTRLLLEVISICLMFFLSFFLEAPRSKL